MDAISWSLRSLTRASDAITRDDVTRKAWHSAYDSIARAMSRGMQMATADQPAVRSPGSPA